MILTEKYSFLCVDVTAAENAFQNTARGRLRGVGDLDDGDGETLGLSSISVLLGQGRLHGEVVWQGEPASSISGPMAMLHSQENLPIVAATTPCEGDLRRQADSHRGRTRSRKPAATPEAQWRAALTATAPARAFWAAQWLPISSPALRRVRSFISQKRKPDPIKGREQGESPSHPAKPYTLSGQAMPRW